MKIEKISIDGKKDSIEVLDRIFSAKVNKRLVNNVLYKTNANYKEGTLKPNNKMKYQDLPQKLMHKKERVMLDTLVEKLLYLLAAV